MQLMTRQKLKELIAEFNRVLTLDDIELITQLDKAADLVVKGVQVAESSLFAYPLLVAGEAFKAPTIGKEIYWKEQVVKAIDDELLSAAYFWVLTLDDVPELRGKDIAKTVKRWAKKCKLTASDVDYIQAYYAPDEEQAQKNADAHGYGEIIALLVREYGKDCNHWLNAPESEIKMLLADWTARQEAKAAAYRKSSGGSRNQVAPAPSPKIQALHRFNLIVAEIKASWSE